LITFDRNKTKQKQKRKQNAKRKGDHTKQRPRLITKRWLERSSNEGPPTAIALSFSVGVKKNANVRIAATLLTHCRTKSCTNSSSFGLRNSATLVVDDLTTQRGYERSNQAGHNHTKTQTEK
jgi:hypothetical protein